MEALDWEFIRSCMTNMSMSTTVVIKMKSSKINYNAFPLLETMMNYVFRNRTLENLIVQQGIPLIRSERRPVDFRVHTNKDNQGNWQVTAIAAKVAGLGSVTTHIKNGGSVKTLKELFENHEIEKEIEQKLTTAAITLSKSIENYLDGIIAEIGFDFGLDKHGQVWMLKLILSQAVRFSTS